MTVAPVVNLSSLVFVPADHASRYLQRLYKHWSHHLTVEFTPKHGKVTFPVRHAALIIRPSDTSTGWPSERPLAFRWKRTI